MTKTLTIALFLTGMTLFSCSKEEVEAKEVSFSALLVGEEEVPFIFTTATGFFSGKYNTSTKILNYTITYTKITPTAWHIHKGAKGAVGNVVFNFGTTFNTPFTGSTAALTTDQETDLMNGMFYFNIHSAKYTNGEIRGQIIKD